MDSEGFHSKERLAVERRAQNLKPIAGDSAAASWAHMRQRLSRAEREARVARRVVVVLACVSLAGMAGVFAVVLPWPAAVGSSRTSGAGSVPAGYTQAPPSLHLRPPTASSVPGPKAAPPAGSSESPGVPSRPPAGGAQPGL